MQPGLGSSPPTSRNPSARSPDFLGTLDYTPTSFDLQAAFDAAHASRPRSPAPGQALRFPRGIGDGRTACAARRRVSTNTRPGAGRRLAWLFKGGTNNFDDSRDGLSSGCSPSGRFLTAAPRAVAWCQAKSVLEQSRLQFTEAQLNVEVEVRTWRIRRSRRPASSPTPPKRSWRKPRRPFVSPPPAMTPARRRSSTFCNPQVDLTTARTNQLPGPAISSTLPSRTCARPPARPMSTTRRGLETS